MNKKITFLLASNTSFPVFQKTVSKSSLAVSGAVLCIIILLLCIVSYDYLNLKAESIHAAMLDKKISGQTKEISAQRKQIQQFAGEINALKSQLAELNSFEKKIRIIANIENDGKLNNVFGVGGVIPEDLYANIPLETKHNSLLREMHDQVNDLSTSTLRQGNNFSSLLKHLEAQRNLLASTPAISPAKGWITSKFGYRQSPFTGRREFHKGLDIANRPGTKIVATADGTVSFAGKKGLLGRTVVVDHGHGMVTRYAHLLKALVKRGVKVKRGDPIAEIGNTGRSTGPHLHYDVRIHGVAVDPEKYIIN